MSIRLPTTRRGRRSAVQEATYQTELRDFCAGILEIASRLDFKVSARGWCYILEEYGVDKGEFQRVQSLIADCRKSGLLPLGITSEDVARETSRSDAGTCADGEDLITYLAECGEDLRYLVDRIGSDYTPTAFWDEQDCYVEMVVEKIDLRSLFEPICEQHYVPLTNSRGWADIHSRANMMRRFQHHESEGRQCVLLYCGDHDPGGLHISEQIRSNLSAVADAAGWTPDDLIIERFGLNYDFITENNLTWVENLETSSGQRLDDPKHKDHWKPYVQDYIRQFGARKVEANALVTRPAAGREMCRQAIEEWVSAEALADYRRRMRQARRDVAGRIPDLVRAVLEDML